MNLEIFIVQTHSITREVDSLPAVQRKARSPSPSRGTAAHSGQARDTWSGDQQASSLDKEICGDLWKLQKSIEAHTIPFRAQVKENTRHGIVV